MRMIGQAERKVCRVKDPLARIVSGGGDSSTFVGLASFLQYSVRARNESSRTLRVREDVVAGRARFEPHVQPGAYRKQDARIKQPQSFAKPPEVVSCA